MQCPRCRHENLPKAKFCEDCAAPLARACSNCSTPLSLIAKFCPECAHPVTAGAAEPRFASPESYTPKHLAENRSGSGHTLAVIPADILFGSRP